MQSIPSMLLGAALVAVGVLVSALADRIRGIRAERREQTSRVSNPRREPAVRFHDMPMAMTPSQPEVPADDSRMADVVSALVEAGYKKPAAVKAAQGCTPAERRDLGDWIAAAFRKANVRTAP